MAQQLFEAASSIGAHLEEGDASGSRADMRWKHVIARREAKESLTASVGKLRPKTEN